MTDYDEDGLRRLAHTIIVSAVNDYTGMKWSYKWERFKYKITSSSHKKSATKFLTSPQSSLSLCCNILDADPDKIREGAESRFKHALPKRKDKDSPVRED